LISDVRLSRWRAGPDTAAAIYAVKRRVGLRKKLAGLDYSRSVEYPFALARLRLQPGQRLLEIGASKLFLALYLAAERDVIVYATDLDPIVMVQERYAREIGRADLLDSGRLVAEVQDACQLSYSPGYFDRVVSISTLEHIERVEFAAAELGRVLAPGGRAIVTVPYGKTYRVDRVKIPAYGGESDQSRTFFQHVFDRETLERKLITPSGLFLAELAFLGEPGFRMTRLIYNRVFGRALAYANWHWPWTARRFYRQIAESEVTNGPENIAVLALEKREGV